MKKIASLLVLPIVATSLASRQLAPQPVSLEATMQFIQDKMAGDRFGYVQTRSSAPGTSARTRFNRSETVADSASCSLRAASNEDIEISVDPGAVYRENGQPVTGDDLRRKITSTVTVSFKDVESVTVEAMQDRLNRGYAKAGHPEITSTVTPSIFEVVLSAPKPLFSFHRTVTKGGQPAKDSDNTSKEVSLSFYDETIATRVSNAMTHAMELCGGGNKDPF